MKNYEWKSDFSPLINDFLEQYRLAGFKFEKQERILQHFDRFCTMQGYAGLELKKYVLEEFIYDKREQKSTHYVKEVVMQQFADFMIKRGYSACRIGHRYQLPRSKYIPHIYTTEEKQRFFYALDHYPTTKLSYRNDFAFSVVPVHVYRRLSISRKRIMIRKMELFLFGAQKTTATASFRYQHL